jgi:hypothetical protein
VGLHRGGLVGVVADSAHVHPGAAPLLLPHHRLVSTKPVPAPAPVSPAAAVIPRTTVASAPAAAAAATAEVLPAIPKGGTPAPALRPTVGPSRARGLHSFPFQLNLRSSVSRITQLNS